MKKLVLYHANCADGFCSAFIAWKKFGDKADYIPVNYGELPPDVTDCDVYILDFSYKRSVLEEMKSKANSLLVLDHHKTAEQELKGLDYCKFDMNKSGARMTLDHFPVQLGQRIDDELVAYVQDRDLWKWELPNSKEISAAIASYPYDFKVWNTFDIDALVTEGIAILRYQNQSINSLAKNAVTVNFEGFKIPCINSSWFMSELGSVLAAGQPFALIWFYDGNSKTYRYSLRSTDAGEDVSVIAKKYGGGGHRNAAGFTSW